MNFEEANGECRNMVCQTDMQVLSTQKGRFAGHGSNPLDPYDPLEPLKTKELLAAD